MDKSIVSLTERLDGMTNRMESRVNTLELWKAGMNQKIATQDQIDRITEELVTWKKYAFWFATTVGGILAYAFFKLILKM